MMNNRPPPPMRSQIWRDSRRKWEATDTSRDQSIGKKQRPNETQDQRPRELEELSRCCSRAFIFYSSGMTTPRRWFDRKFELGLGPEVAREIFARLRSTPLRLI